MSHPPLRRHPALQPFSRDHFSGLHHAQQLIRAASSDVSERRAALGAFLNAWTHEIEDHFAQEEHLLRASMTPDHSEQLRADHAALRTLVAEAKHRLESRHLDANQTLELGKKLRDHIRWEERVLFPAIEATTSEEVLKDVGRETQKMESRRVRRSPPDLPTSGPD